MAGRAAPATRLRQAPVGGICDVRGASLAVDPHHQIARIGPESVVAASRPRGPAATLIKSVGLQSDFLPVVLKLSGRPRILPRVTGDGFALDLRQFLVSQDEPIAVFSSGAQGASCWRSSIHPTDRGGRLTCAAAYNQPARLAWPYARVIEQRPPDLKRRSTRRQKQDRVEQGASSRRYLPKPHRQTSDPARVRQNIATRLWLHLVPGKAVPGRDRRPQRDCPRS